MTPSTPNIDMDKIERLSFAIERNAHRSGWDSPPELYAIYDATDEQTAATYKEYGFGQAIHLEGYAAIPIIPSEVLCPSPVRALFFIAYNLGSKNPKISLAVEILKQPGFIGIAHQVETWSNTMSPEERKADTRDLVDIPGSIEQRVVLTTLRDETIHSISRARGQKPSVNNYDKPPQGPLIDALKVIVAIACGKPVDNMRLTIPRGMVLNHN